MTKVLIAITFFCVSLLHNIQAFSDEPKCPKIVEKAESKKHEADQELLKAKEMLRTSLMDHDAKSVDALVTTMAACEKIQVTKPTDSSAFNAEQATVDAINAAIPDPDDAADCYSAMASEVSGGKRDMAELCVYAGTYRPLFPKGAGGINTTPGKSGYGHCRSDIRKLYKAYTKKINAMDEVRQAKNECLQQAHDRRQEERVKGEGAEGQSH